jgi:VWFA-related protein
MPNVVLGLPEAKLFLGEAVATVRRSATQETLSKTIKGMICLLLASFVCGVGSAQVSAQAPADQSQQQQPQTAPSQGNEIPDAPAVQPGTEPPPERPAPKPEEKKPAPARNPWTNQPETQPSATQPPPDTGNEATPPPPMPPVRTVPPGSTKIPKSQEEIYTLTVTPTFVQIPVTVKDHDGRLVDGLLPTDFTVKENGVVQKLRFFSADPFALSVAVILDLGMPDVAVQKVNQTFSALVGSFAPYDEVAVYTYSSTVSDVTDYMGASQKLAMLMNQIKTERGHNNGPAVLSGPLAPNGPIINGIPVGSPTQPVYTPPKESHVLNDAILRAALDLRKRPRDRRKIIFVISDGREYGSQASYRDVLRVLLSNEIQVKAIAVDSAALPVYDKLEKLRLPKEGYSDILPKYVAATGGSPVYHELSRSAIENMYAEVMSDARNQYTLGYYATRPKVPTSSAYRSIEVVVHRPGLKIYAKDGYYPAPIAAR